MNSNKKLKQSLKIIEGLCLLFEDGDMTLKSAEKMLGEIYKIAHLHGACKNPHSDWREDRVNAEKALKHFGITA